MAPGDYSPGAPADPDVDPSLYVPGDAALTTKRIASSTFLHGLGTASNLARMISFLCLVSVLHTLLASVGRSWARLVVVFVIVGATVTCLNMANQLTATRLLRVPNGVSAETSLLAMTLLDMHQQGVYLAGFFWGLWLFPFGRLVYASDFLPRSLGVLLVIGCFAYLLNSSAYFFLPSYQGLTQLTLLVPTAAELYAIAWLIVRGVREP